MPQPDAILIGLIMMGGVAGSAWAWWTMFSGPAGPFWKVPRTTPLPARTPLLFVAGGMLLILRELLKAILVPLVIPQAAGPLPEDPAAGASERLVLTYQIIGGVSLLVIFAGSVFIATRSAEDRRALGFRLDGLKQQTWYGVQGFLLAFIPVYFLVFVVWKLNLKDEPESVHELLRLVSDGYVFWPMVVAILIAPIQEELLYRVFLQEGLVAAGYPVRVALPAVAIFFSFAHLFPDMIPLVPLALLFGATMHYRCSFLACVVMHMLFNGFNIALTLLGGTA